MSARPGVGNSASVDAAPGNDALCLRDLRKSFGPTEIIRGVSLDVHAGERHAIIGPNGAGKSTLFHLISGRFPLSSGEILLHGDFVFDGYWHNEQATADAISDDGWFRTGDIGEIDDDGYLRLVGRASDLIITGGYNVYPREVEDAILEHPDVVDVAVVGVPDDTWGETVVAYVVTAADLADLGATLGAHVEHRLAAYKRPRAWASVDELPRNAMGKVRRDVLRGGWRMSS